MPKLTDAQLVILSAAAARDDRTALPVPKSIRMNKGALAACFNSLIKPGLLSERAAPPNVEAWRQDEDGKRFTLVISDTGLRAIGVEETNSQEKPKAKEKAEPKASGKAKSTSKPTTKPDGKTKLDVLRDLLSRKTGCTIEEAAKATGWQHHSIRGAISGALKKKLGLTIKSEKTAKGRIYRITSGR